jgi:signal transduction histidine kinase
VTTLRAPTPASTAGTSELSADSEVRLPRPPGVLRRWLVAHPRLVDGIIVATYVCGSIMMLGLELLVDEFTDSPGSGAPLTSMWLVLLVLLVAIVSVALAYRRKYPLIGLIVVGALFFVEQGLVAFPNGVALVFLLYAVPVHQSVRAAWIGYAVTVALTTAQVFLTGAAVSGGLSPAGWVAEGPLDLGESFAVSVANAISLLAVLMIGINFGNRRRYVRALIERAHQLVREREQRAQLAASEERARIAREMHDIIAHSLSVVVTLSEAASVAIDTQPNAAKHAMERAAETGRESLHEMRRLLGVLNDRTTNSIDAKDGLPAEQHAEGAELEASRQTNSHKTSLTAPQPELAQLPELIEGFREAGLRVTVHEAGISAGDSSNQLAVFRIVQEGLTNALRYAGRGADAQLSLTHTAHSTTIELIDSGPSSLRTERPHTPQLSGSGRGLAGARERARLFRGTLEAGPHGGGWRLWATVPVDPLQSSSASLSSEHHEPQQKETND